MRIGQLARKAGVNLQTIRFYEREGLLPQPVRNSAGYRCFEQRHFERVLFIRRNQQLGFTLAEIKQLLDLHKAVCTASFPIERKPSELLEIIEIGRERLQLIEEKIRVLTGMQRQLAEMMRWLESPVVPACPATRASSICE
jgi:MerR family transcriptional regulator, mercuric resistance operon regulatory protein